jgi:hypothetical protein
MIPKIMEAMKKIMESISHLCFGDTVFKRSDDDVLFSFVRMLCN